MENWHINHKNHFSSKELLKITLNFTMIKLQVKRLYKYTINWVSIKILQIQMVFLL